MKIDDAFKKYADYYYQQCEKDLVKLAVIRKLPSGGYRILSEKGKNLGTYDSKEKAEKRLKQIEFFKYLAEQKDKNKAEDKFIDLTEAETFSLSAIMRQLNKNANKSQVLHFLKIYKEQFDLAFKKGLPKVDQIVLRKALFKFNKDHKIKLSKKIVKNAASVELGDSKLVGEYLANIVKFILKRISPQNRLKALDKVKQKIYLLNENEISLKKMPASSSMGQSITFVKTVLFNQDPKYIRSVINHLVRNL